MARAGSKDSTGDKFQIVSMTLAMTGGGFLLLTLLFALWWNPGARSDVESLKKDYGTLTDLLKKPENKGLRDQAKKNAAQQASTQSLREIISDGLNRYDLQGSFPKAKVTDQKGIEKVEQSIELKPAPLKSIFQFLGFVKDQKKSIQVEDLGVNRLQRGKDADADSWTASFSFVDYVTKGKE